MDQEIICIDCNSKFIHSVRDQEFFNSQTPPFTPPKRCKNCRMKRKAEKTSYKRY